MTLTTSQVSALREVENVWPGRQTSIVGATALGFRYGLTWRQTQDLDLVVAIDLEGFPGALLECPGWTQHPRKQHAFRSPDGVELDILPAGPEILQRGVIEWDSGHVMNMVGIDLALRHADVHTIHGYGARVATPAVVAVLKMAAYLDRPAERTRDLTDLAHLMDIYVDDDCERRWVQMERRGPARWTTEGDPLERRLRVFRLGLDASAR